MQRAADVVGYDLRLPRLDVRDLQRRRLALCAQHEQHELPGIHPRVITNRSDAREDQLRRLAVGVEAPQPLNGRCRPVPRAIELRLDDAETTGRTDACWHEGRRVFVLRCLRELRDLAAGAIEHVDVDLPAVAIAGKQDLRSVGAEVRLVVVTGSR